MTAARGRWHDLTEEEQERVNRAGASRRTATAVLEPRLRYHRRNGASVRTP